MERITLEYWSLLRCGLWPFSAWLDWIGYSDQLLDLAVLRQQNSVIAPIKLSYNRSATNPDSLWPESVLWSISLSFILASFTQTIPASSAIWNNDLETRYLTKSPSVFDCSRYFGEKIPGRVPVQPPRFIDSKIPWWIAYILRTTQVAAKESTPRAKKMASIGTHEYLSGRRGMRTRGFICTASTYPTWLTASDTVASWDTHI